MCFHNRFIYGCGHDGWGAEIVACRLQRAFRDGFWAISCPDMYAHPLHTLKLQVRCKKCVQNSIKAEKTADKLLQVKLAMTTLSDTVRKLKDGASGSAAEGGNSYIKD